MMPLLSLFLAHFLFLFEIEALDVDGADATACASPPEQDSLDDNKPIWWDYTIDEMFENLFDCGEILYQDTQSLSDNDIDKIRQHFNEIRDKYAKEVNLVPIQQPTPEQSHTIMTVPNEIKGVGLKGKGLFAKDMIKKGTLVQSLNAGNVGIFKDGATWRAFVANLPRETACNFIEWSWIQEIVPEEGNEDDIRNGLTIFFAFDESSLMNSGGWKDGEEANIRCGFPPEGNFDDDAEWGPCRFDYYATRDIEAGEELLLNYSEFEDEDQHQWTDIGL